MKNHYSFAKLLVLLATLALLLPFPTLAQEGEAQEGVNQGNYNIKQSFEFGGRIADFTGNRAVYRTFDNLWSGPRLLEHTLQMRSLDHAGVLFDDFFLTSFGYGGDPNAITRLRIYKNKWYNFSGTFRMARQQWDYNLLANPLNPPTSNPAFPITVSLHKFETVRRLSDFNLTLMPQSRFRVRVGYARNVMEGPSFSSFHEGTDVLLFQNWKTTLDSYSFGFDFRMLPKTNISYDQFFQYYKGDTTWEDPIGSTVLGVPRFFAQLSTGMPVDLGAIFDTGSNSPCGTPITNPTTTPPTANPTCNGYQFYERTGNVRTDYPTEQLSFQTSYFRNLDISGRVAYSSSDNDTFGYQEGYLGRVTRTNHRVFGIDGPSNSKRVSATADFGITWQAMDRLRFVDTFHFTHYRIPGLFDLTECSLFGTTMAANPFQYTGQATVPPRCAAVLTATGTSTTVGTPTHSNSSPADVVNETVSAFLGQDTKQNQFEVLYDFTSRFSGRLGYRFTRRTIRHGHLEAEDLLFFPDRATRGACSTTAPTFPDCVLQSDGLSYRLVEPLDGEIEDTRINEHVFLVGFTARPTNELRMIFDAELASADESFTRISPRQFQLYRFRTIYQPTPTVNLGFMFNILEKRNNVVEVAHKQHNRTVGLTATYEPSENFMLDFGYDFNDVFSQTNICFVANPLPPGTSPCPDASSRVQQISLYDQDTHYGYFGMLTRPVKRVTARFGYSVVSTSGDTLIINPNSPLGPLQFNYHKPYAAFDFDLTRGFTFRTNWGYYEYNERSLPDASSAPRDFRGNLVTLSIRYGF